MKILLTGGTGFVGNRLATVLSKAINLSVIVRNLEQDSILFPSEVRLIEGDLCRVENLKGLFDDIDVVIHCAARVHVMNDKRQSAENEFTKINTQSTKALAEMAAAKGVKRFIFLSSVKVNGESTQATPFKESDKRNPEDAYGLSKAEAEETLKKVSAETNMEVVIIRPPLVYGRGVKANFAAMMNLAKKNLPLPLGAIRNRRSLVALDNLVDLIITCIEHPKAANQTFLVSDDHDVSTTELLQMMTRAVGKKPMLLPVPVSLLRLAGKLVGKQAVIDRLCGNLQVDISHTKNTIGWKPPITVEEGIKRCFVKEESA